MSKKLKDTLCICALVFAVGMLLLTTCNSEADAKESQNLRVYLPITAWSEEQVATTPTTTSAFMTVYWVMAGLITIALIIWGIRECAHFEGDNERELQQMIGECNGLIYHPTKNSSMFD